MRVDPELVFPPPIQAQADGGEPRPKQDVPRPVAGSPPSPRESVNPANGTSAPSTPQDEVKLQWDSQNQIAIYQFLNQRGELVEQVPSQQMINLARQIEQQLHEEAAARRAVGNVGGKPNDY